MNQAISRLLARTTETLLPKRVVSRLRERRQWMAWIDSVDADSLADLSVAPDSVKRTVFSKHVKLVEIETHARCNRICSFCPNTLVDRRRNRTVTDSEMLRRIFTELGSVGYARQIKVARYSEPLANPHLYERIVDARRLVPRAQLAIVTNTDYLTRTALARLKDSGLDVLFMSIYLKTRERWSLPLAHQYKREISDKLGVRVLSEEETPVSLVCLYAYAGMTLRSACMNFDEYGTDRGGTMTQFAEQPRAGPCREPFETLVIDYNGSVMPCCNLRSDIPNQVKFAVGDLSIPDASIFDIYCGALSAWRRSMVGFGPKEAPCATCRHRDVSGDLGKKLEQRMRRHLQGLRT